jgi:hypothetical protein
MGLNAGVSAESSVQDYVVLHLFNATTAQEAALHEQFVDQHVAAVQQLRGFRDVQRFRCASHQLIEILQPWTHATFYNFTTSDPDIDLPAIAPLLADIRAAGVFADDGAERIYTYRMYHPWKYSANHNPAAPLSHIMFLLANVVAGRDREYHKWYDDVHSVEVSESPGYVGMRRGGLCEVQVPPVKYCPGDQLILGGIQSEASALEANLKDFVDRAYGNSPSGVAWGPRSNTASTARTVHIFESVDGPFNYQGKKSL